MATTVAFDVYGTLIDTSGVITALEKVIGGQATVLSHLWRDKQLEYSFRRGLMQNYRDFSVCTRQALDYVCEFLEVEISDTDKQSLMEGYKVLPAYADVEEGLPRLKQAGIRMFAFSNGRADDVRGLLVNAGIEGHFEGVVSVDGRPQFQAQSRRLRPFPAPGRGQRIGLMVGVGQSVRRHRGYVGGHARGLGQALGKGRLRSLGDRAHRHRRRLG